MSSLWAVISVLVAFLATSLYRHLAHGSNSFQCSVLSLALGQKVSYPASVIYKASATSYWSRQEELLVPSCVIRPANAQDVATAVTTLTRLNKLGLPNCKFAIRGGGHTPWAGSANIDGGVTIDLSAIRDITLNHDRTVTSVGAGARWGDVYQKMDSQGLAVVGGRGASIGVGGLLTGGKHYTHMLHSPYVTDS